MHYLDISDKKNECKMRLIESGTSKPN